MLRKGYVPFADDQFLIWHTTLKGGALTYAATVGLTGTDTAALTADNTDFNTKLNALSVAKAAQKTATDNKNMSRITAEARARALIKRIKAHPAYTPAIGEAMGIIGPEVTDDIHTTAPVLTGVDLGGGLVELRANRGISEAIALFCKRGDEPDFTRLAIALHFPYIDNRPMLVAGKSELREYRAKFMSGDEVVGLFSNELVISCKP